MKKIFQMLGFIALYFVTYLVAGFVVGIYLTIYLLIKYFVFSKDKAFDINSSALMTSEVMKYTGFIVVLSSLIALFLFWTIYIVRKRKLFEECNFSRLSIKSIALLTISGISLNFFVGFMVSFVIEAASLQRLLPEYTEISNKLFSGNILWIILSVCIVAPVFEEIFFRSMILNELKRCMPLSAAIVIQAFLFGLFHLNWIQGTYAFLLGILFALVYIWTKSLWASIALHVTFNTTSFIINKFINKEILNKFEYALPIIGFVICAAAMYFIYREYKSKGEASLNIEDSAVL